MIDVVLHLRATHTRARDLTLWLSGNLQAGGMDINRADSDGNTALTLAAAHGHRDIVDVLLQAPKIEVDCTDYEGDTGTVCTHLCLSPALLRLCMRGTL